MGEQIALLSHSVPGLGLEPRWIAPPVFETGASTDSAIRACSVADAKLSNLSRLCKHRQTFCPLATL